MRFHGLDLNLLVVLDALLTEKSITATADRLHRTQPAVSASLKRLREYFGDELFVMSGRVLMPTPRALTLAQPVRDALAHIKDAVIQNSEFDPKKSRRKFRIIMSDYMATVFFGQIVRRAALEAPDIRFEIIQFDDDFDAPLNRGEVDFLLFPETYMSERHPKQILFSEQMVAVRCAQQFNAEMSRKVYFGSPHVAVRFGKTRKPAIEEFLINEIGLRREIEVVLPNFTLATQYVCGTRRIATMHRRLAEQMAETMPLQIDPLPFALPPYHEALQWPQLNDKDPASVWLRSVIAGEAGLAADRSDG
ncbi:LysR family transcriptional regulator [Roseibium litorale]|uniref:LysR family transcriptional regulator n=1 Tax=Roseibium litorale TaxID=2803841 RepID=A0ABR9CRY9_9HYPH|nr:LysR family transcriptional regulator [Roseibium litorale]MBD8893646.1 LysR family transcriptional regulator [Roseibium litorale]